MQCAENAAEFGNSPPQERGQLPDIAASIEVDNAKPSRSWLNDFAVKHGFSLKTSVEIERGRLTCVYSHNLMAFLSFVGDLTKEVPPELVFNCDETMMSSKRLFKVSQ